jgi:hypothetical protein
MPGVALMPYQPVPVAILLLLRHAASSTLVDRVAGAGERIFHHSGPATALDKLPRSNRGPRQFWCDAWAALTPDVPRSRAGTRSLATDTSARFRGNKLGGREPFRPRTSAARQREHVFC